PVDHEIAAGRIEVRRRLVENPQARAAELEAAEAETTSLSCGKIASAHVEPCIETQLRGKRLDVPACVPDAPAEVEVLAHGQLALQPVRVAAIPYLAAHFRCEAANVRSAPTHSPGRGQREAR